MYQEKFCKIGAALSGVLLLLLAGQSNAAILTLDPDNYADGTVLNNVLSGVTLSAVDGATGTVGNITALTSASIASTGVKVFDSPFAQNGQFGNGIWDYMLIDVSGLSHFKSLSLDFIGTDASDLNPVLAAYDAWGNLVTGASAPGVFGTGDSVTLTVMGAGITTIAALGNPNFGIGTLAGLNQSSGGSDSWAFDNLQITVPEPASLFLMGIGLAGIGMTRRRKALDA